MFIRRTFQRANLISGDFNSFSKYASQYTSIIGYQNRVPIRNDQQRFNTTTSSGKTDDMALFVAAINNDVGQINQLAARGVDVNVRINAPQIVGMTPLTAASWYGNISAVKRLIELGADVNRKSNDSSSPLLRACQDNKYETAEYLLNCNADVHDVNSNGYSSLLIASLNGYAPLVKLLLERGADVNYVCVNGETSLMKAAKKGHVDTINALLEYKADTKMKNVAGQSAADVAVYYKQKEAFFALEQYQ